MSLAQLAQLKCRQSNVNPIIIRGWILRQATQLSLIPYKANPSPFCQSRVKSLPISSQSEDNCPHHLGTSLLYGSTTGLDGGQFCARGLDQWNSNRTTPLPTQCCSTNTQPNHQYQVNRRTIVLLTWEQVYCWDWLLVSSEDDFSVITPPFQ